MALIEQFKFEDKKSLFILVEELQDYLVQIDPLKRLRRLSGYGEKYIENLLKIVEDKNGIIFVAKSENIPCGFIAGIIEEQEENNLLECIPTKAGRILDLIVSEKYRKENTGTSLMGKIEEYFKQQCCDIVRVEVFEPNNPARNFYKKLEYNDRVIDMIKKLK